VDWGYGRRPTAGGSPSILCAIVVAGVCQPSALAGGAAWWLLFSFFHHRAAKHRRQGSGAYGRHFGGGDAKFAVVCGILAAWHGPGWVLLAMGAAGLLSTGAILSGSHGREATVWGAAAMGEAMALGTLLTFLVTL